MNEENVKKLVGESLVSLEMTVAEFSDLLYMLNLPLAVPSITWASYIEKINAQLVPQVKKLEDTYKGLKNEPKAAS